MPLPSQPAAAGTHLPTPEDRRLSRPWCEVALQDEIRTCNLSIANPALYTMHTATSAPSFKQIKVLRIMQISEKGKAILIRDTIPFIRKELVFFLS